MLGIAFGAVYGSYQWNKPHRNVQAEAAVAQLQATELLSAFQSNYDSVWNALKDEVILVEGAVATVERENEKVRYISMDVEGAIGGVICYFDSTLTIQSLREGERIIVKGKLNGYDPDILQEVELMHCTIEN